MNSPARKSGLAVSLGFCCLVMVFNSMADQAEKEPKTPPAAPPQEGLELPVAGDRPAIAEGESEEVMYKVWAAEVFGSEGDFEKAAREYVAAALMSENPAIAKRATEVAVSAQSWLLASMAADRWVVLEPGSREARETVIRTFLAGGDYVQLEYQLQELLGMLVEEQWQGWDRIAALMAGARDGERADAVLQRIVEQNDAAENPYAMFARSQAKARSGQFGEALTLIEQAIESAPREAAFYTWGGRLALSQRDDEAARAYYQGAWQLQPTEVGPAMAYAEILRQTGDPDGANDALATLPDTPLNRFNRIAFATESGNRPLASSLYEGFQNIPYGDKTELAFQAARSAEVLELKQEAIAWYAKLDGTDRSLIALLRRAYLLSEIGRIEESRDVLRFARNSGSATVQMETMLVETQILIEAKRSEEAFALLEKALAQFPGDTRLLYTRALIYAELGRVDGAEADLRAVLQSEPSNAAALNALGYTLADQTNRLAEAEQLIQRAYAMEPDDPAIIDSMGWIAYRLGKLEEAEQYLKQAFLRDRNAEIAAHLGEVLWVQDKERDARTVWNEGMRIDPANRVLADTLKRYGIEL